MRASISKMASSDSLRESLLQQDDLAANTGLLPGDTSFENRHSSFYDGYDSANLINKQGADKKYFAELQTWSVLRRFFDYIGIRGGSKKGKMRMTTKRSAFDSYEFEEFLSPINLIYLRSKSYLTWKIRALKRWSLLIAVAIVVALVVTMIIYGIHTLLHAKFSVVYSIIDMEMDGKLPKGLAVLVFLGINLAYSLLATFPVTFVEPISGSSGMPELKAILNGVIIPRALRIKTLICKVFGNMFSTASGLPAGYEGPMAHNGAMIASGLSQGKSTTLGIDTSFSVHQDFRNDVERRDFIFCGAAAGVAAAFNAPTGGTIFILEEAGSFWHQKLTWRAFFTSITAAYIVDFLLSGLTFGNWGQLTTEGMFTFGTFNDAKRSTRGWYVWEIPMFILVGAAAGVIGALFNIGNVSMAAFRMKYIAPKRSLRVLEVATLTIIASLTAYYIPYYLGTCRPIPEPDPEVNAFATPNLPVYAAVSTVRTAATANQVNLLQVPQASSDSTTFDFSESYSAFSNEATELSNASEPGLWDHFWSKVSWRARNGPAITSPSFYQRKTSEAAEEPVDNSANNNGRLLNSSKGEGSSHRQEYVSFYCPKGEHNSMATFWFTTPEETMKTFFHYEETIGYDLVLTFFGVYIVTLCFTSGSSIPSGIFIPGLLAGAALGRGLGELMHVLAPKGAIADAGSYSLIGAAAMIGGVQRITISVAVILLEATGNYLFALPLMVAVLSARFVGNIFNHGIYEMQISLRKWPVLEDKPEKTVSHTLRVSDVMAPAPFIFLEIESVGRLHSVLTSCSHNGFPVIFSEHSMRTHPRLGTLAGYIQRSQISVLLASKAFHPSLPVSLPPLLSDLDPVPSQAPQIRPYPPAFSTAVSIVHNPTNNGSTYNDRRSSSSAAPHNYSSFSSSHPEASFHGPSGVPDDQQSIGRESREGSVTSLTRWKSQDSTVPAILSARTGRAQGTFRHIQPPSQSEVPVTPKRLFDSITRQSSSRDMQSPLKSTKSSFSHPIRQMQDPNATLLDSTYGSVEVDIGPILNAPASPATPAPVGRATEIRGVPVGSEFHADSSDSLSIDQTRLRSSSYKGNLRNRNKWEKHKQTQKELIQRSTKLYRNMYSEEGVYPDEPLLTQDDVDIHYPRFPNVSAMSFSEQEKASFVDLRPYMDATPVTVHVNAPLTRAYRIFRTLGLRHLIVVNDCGDCVGIITRHDLTEHRLEEVYATSVYE